MTTDKVIRIKRAPRDTSNPYFMHRRATAQDRGLSYEARGMLGDLLSRPDDWQVKPAALQTDSCGRDKVYRILSELEQAGYLVREWITKKGVVQGIEYVVYESPFPEKPDTAQPDTENTDTTYKRKEQSTESTDESSNDLDLGNELSLVDSSVGTSPTIKASPSTSPITPVTGNPVSTPPILPVSNTPPAKTLPATPAAVVSDRFTKSRWYAFNESTGRVCIKTYTAKEAAAKAPELAPFGYKMIKGSELNARADAESLVFVRNDSTSTMFDVFAEYSFGIKQGQGISKSVAARIGSIINDFAELLMRTRNEIEHDSALTKQVKACFQKYREIKPSGFDLPNTGPSFIKWWNNYLDLQAAPVTSTSALSGFKMN